MKLLESTPRAGAYAQQRYERGLAAYRSRARPFLAVLFGPFIALGLVGAFVEGHPLAWAAGVVCGVGVGATIAVRESPPAYIENWLVGAEGERKTEKALRSLDRSRWLVVHDIEAACGNYDHIVLSPAGVFLLETKNLSGTLRLKGGRPYLRRRLDPDADKPCDWLVRDALARAAHLHEDLEHRVGRCPWVRAVAVVWSDFDEGVHDTGKCVVVHGSRLIAWLGTQVDELDQTIVSELSACVAALAGEAG